MISVIKSVKGDVRMDPKENSVAEKLRRYREACVLSQKQVADALNIERSTYTKYETGDTEPNLNTIVKIAAIYNVSPTELLPMEVSADASVPVITPVGRQQQLISIGVLVFYGALYNIPELAGVKINVIDIYALEAFCWFGAYCVPLPGAVGASEAIFNNVFSMVISNVVLLDSTMVITRGINFYISFMFAGVVTLVHHIHVHFLTKSSESPEEQKEEKKEEKKSL